MGLFTRMKNGWKLGLTSLKIIRDNTSLLLFPIISTMALLFVLLTFLGGIFGIVNQVGLESLDFMEGNEAVLLIALFIMYLISYFIIVFFNVGLVHCARQVFNDEEPSIKEGVSFATSRIASIFSWAMLAATVGVFLNVLQNRTGALGELIGGLIGMAWSIVVFFVVPVIAYENVNAVDAVKRSGQVMKEQWGEALGANFGFGLFYLIGYVILIPVGILLLNLNPIMAVVSIGLCIFLMSSVISAAKTVFISAAYLHINDQPVGEFEGEALDSIFMAK